MGEQSISTEAKADEKEVLQQLLPPMAQELLSHMYRTIISRMPIVNVLSCFRVGV